MGKIVVVLALMLGLVMAEEALGLEKKCLACHKTQQIPNMLINRRYLMKYSTKIRIEKAMLAYLRNPKKATSIMPPQFFLKFPMKEALKIDEQTLRKNIQAYIDLYDVKKVLVLEKSSH